MKKRLNKEHCFLFLILVASFIARIIYVFYFTDYKNYLFSDMGGYWSRAIGRYEGDFYSPWQWTCWATFFHFYLTFIFKILAFLKIFDYKLEIVLFLNIVYSTISIFFFYLVSVRILGNLTISLIATFCYAFTYPLIYFNSLVLSENLSIPTIVIAFYLVLVYNKSKSILFLAGITLAIAVASRPALGLLGLPFFLYIFFTNKPYKQNLLRSMYFALGFFLVIFLVIQENSRISNGELKNLAGGGGVNFFIAQCKPSIVKSVCNGLHVHISLGVINASYPNLKEFNTDHPIHDQKYFYKLGMECLKKDPLILLKNLKNYKEVLFGPFFPMIPSAKGFDFFINISRGIIFFMTISLGVLYFLLKLENSVVCKKTLILLVSILVSIIIMMYFFPAEFRYLLPAYFAIYLLFFSIVMNIRKYKRAAFNYFRILILILFLYWLIN